MSTGMRVLQCPYCDRKITGNAGMAIHVKAYHPGKKIPGLPDPQYLSVREDK